MDREEPDLTRAAGAEAIGTLLLVAAVVGSGIMAERLADGNAALALLANSIATGGALFALVLALGPVSGAHFNPVVTLALAWRGDLPRTRVASYVVAQVVGGAAGAVLANLMFALPWVSISAHARDGSAQWLAEVIATFGLVGVVLMVGRQGLARVAAAVAAYITAAYWFTSSTSFANPAVTLARTLSDSFAGIRPGDAPGFVLAQLLGGAIAVALFGWLLEPGARERR